MPSLSFATLDVFTHDRYAGNPLAVVRLPRDSHVSTEQMQTIAREFNLSETIFVHDGQTAKDGVQEWRVRIFLTKTEIPFAGHPTIGCAVYALGTLANNAKQGRFIANAGTIELDFADGVAKASIPHNFHHHTQSPLAIADILKSQPQLQGAFDQPPVLKGTEPVNVVSPVKGLNVVIVELPNLQCLGSVTTNSEPSPTLDDGWNFGFSCSYFYVITAARFEEGKDATYHIQSRMVEGSFEDPATGSAACALSCFIALYGRHSRTTRFNVTQGVEMGRKSEIGVTVVLHESLDSVERVELSGSAIQVMEGILEY